MGIPRTEDPSWVYPSDMPDGHGLAKESCPRSKEYGSHVVISCLYHMANLPKLINKGLGDSVREPKFMSNDFKAAFKHELTKAIGAWIRLLIKGGDTLKILSLPSRLGGH